MRIVVSLYLKSSAGDREVEAHHARILWQPSVSSLWVSKALVSRAAADRAINEINAHSENMMVEPHGEEKHNAESTPTL